MKYVVVLGDGMADYPVNELSNKTPLQYANKPVIDGLARKGIIGLVKTVPDDMPPGSDTANMAVMGYNPREYYSGRSPFEAASMGVKMLETDVTFRCNLVTLSADEPYDEKVMLDHSADEITTAEAAELIEAIKKHFATEEIKFYPGISYRHLMLWHNGPYKWNLTPPHDILGKKIKDYLPKGERSEVIDKMMRQSNAILAEHEINKRRVARGLRPANSIWIWGEGKKPLLSSFYAKYKLTGSVISAVDLIKGLGLCAGFDSIDVEGATGTIHTNFVGKAKAAVAELKKGKDFVYVHLEAPDECGHRGEIMNKVKSIELIDEQVVKVIVEELNKANIDFKLMLLPDHATPLSRRTHTHDRVPFLIYQSNMEKDKVQTYDEICAKNAEFYIEDGYKLMDYFINGRLA